MAYLNSWYAREMKLWNSLAFFPLPSMDAGDYRNALAYACCLAPVRLASSTPIWFICFGLIIFFLFLLQFLHIFSFNGILSHHLLHWVCFTWNHFLPRIEVDWLVQGKVPNEKEHFHCKDSSHKTVGLTKGINKLGLLPLSPIQFASFSPQVCWTDLVVT